MPQQWLKPLRRRFDFFRDIFSSGIFGFISVTTGVVLVPFNSLFLGPIYVQREIYNFYAFLNKSSISLDLF